VIGPRFYSVIPLRTWEAVICDALIGLDPEYQLQMAEALCSDRKDARAIAKRLNGEARKAWVRDRAKAARRREREQARAARKAGSR